MAERPPSRSPAPLPAPFAAKLGAPRGARRIDALLSEDDAPAAVAELTAAEVFELVAEVGFEDAGDLIALATPAQVQGCLDFASWDKDTYLPEAFRPWLASLLEVGFEKVGEVWAGLDPEARALFLQRHVEVFDLTLGEGPEEDDDAPMMPTPDGFFVLKLLGDDDAQRLTLRLVEDLYRADAGLARNTIQAARAEPPAELEEMSYRWRAGRLADLGYIDFYEALELFQPLELDRIRLDDDAPVATLEPEGSAPAGVLEEVLARPFLARALALIEDPAELARIEAAVMYLVNRVLAAARAKPGQQEVVRRAASYASATLSLGLEAVARGDAERGALALGRVDLPRLFRAGFTLTVRLAKLALALAPRAVDAEEPARAVVTAMSSPKPLWARAADSPPAVGVRPFESLADIRRGTEVLRALTVRIALVEGLGVDLVAHAQAPQPRPTLETFLRTALARAAAGGAWAAAPLTHRELDELRRRALPDGELTEDARRRCHEVVAGALDPAQLLTGAQLVHPIVDELLADLAATLGGVADASVDPRFVESVLVEAADR
ncbi:MAG: DUF6178 family protein [Kofleriaceae bacterium]